MTQNNKKAIKDMEREAILSMVQDCEELESRLSDWERGYLDSMRELISENIELSENQIDRVEGIWESVNLRR